MPTGTLSPVARQKFFDAEGAPLAGGLLSTFQAGTSTPATTYSDIDLLVPNPNPIELDAAGLAPAIYLEATSYKYILTDADAVVQWTQDDIGAVNAGASGLGEIFVFGGQSSSPVTVTSYPSGATFDKLHPGTAVFNIDSADLSGTYVLEVVGQVTSGDTLTVALVNLDAGAPDTPLVTATITSTTGARAQSGAITFAAPGAAANYGVKAKMDTGTGFLWGVRLMRTA